MRTINVDRSKANSYLQKAEECKNSMKRDFDAGEWNACVVSAIHSAISSADAICVAKKGLRSAGKSHDEALVLFFQIEPGNEEFKKSAKHLSELLRIKTNAEYGERLFYEKDAGMAVKHAERFLSFVKEKIREY